MKITYNPDYDRHIRAGFIGCGGHAYRNIFPTFQYAPIDLVAVCDLNGEKANQTARLFGARSSYTDYREMLARESLEAVFVVTGYDADGRPTYPAIAATAMQAGVHAWIEKPPAASTDEIRNLMQVSKETGKFVVIGLKKMFNPANEKAKTLITQPEFGKITTIAARYPQSLPAYEYRHDLRKMGGFLDHIVHPYSVLKFLAGSVASIYVERNDTNGASVTAIRFVNGAIGSLHLCAGQASVSPLERTEIVGESGNVVVDNNIRVTYYRGNSGGAGYGQEADYYHDTNAPTLFWEPEFSLGQLYNKGLFILGYAQEVLYFCNCVLDNKPPERANLDDALELMHIYNAYCQPEGKLVEIIRPS